MYDAWRHRFAVLAAGATLVLIFAGGLVTSTGSGLAVPDWPLSYGMLMPPMVGGIFYEHGHRMVAASVGFLTLVLALWTWRVERRSGVRRLAWAALAAVIAQGLLGGLTVLFLLPTPISVAHACLAQAFFCLTLALAYAGSREWLDAAPTVTDRANVSVAARVATALVFVQLGLGALVRHTQAGLAIADFPLAQGRLIPAFDSPQVAIHFAHRVFALVVLAAVARLFVAARRSGLRPLARTGAAALLLAVAQSALGALTVLSAKAVLPTTLHVATGAAVLGACFLAVLRARRLTLPATPSPSRVAMAGVAA
ncbi:MAG TPA: COX15/CtaA family protein [Vicinamibacteria bacterium]|nr:COX15/CtaA family protein [Vicinamibacteria bacterium]